MNAGLLFLLTNSLLRRLDTDGRQENHVSSSERLDKAISLHFKSIDDIAHYFSPTMLTDGNGEIAR